MVCLIKNLTNLLILERLFINFFYKNQLRGHDVLRVLEKLGFRKVLGFTRF